MDEDIKLVVTAIIGDSAEMNSLDISSMEIFEKATRHMNRIKIVNHNIGEQIKSAISDSLNVAGEEPRHEFLRNELVEVYTNALGKIRYQVACDEARRAWENSF